MLNPHDLAASLCKFSSNETIFRGMTPQFTGAAMGNKLGSAPAGYQMDTPTLDHKI